jgi:hypothetical protein
MAGSITWRIYTANVPVNFQFAIQIDESNAEATYNGQQLMPPSNFSGPVQAPRSLRCRTISARLVGNDRITRQFKVGTSELWNLIAGDAAATILAPLNQDPNDASGGAQLTWRVINAMPERYTRRARVLDSGLLDGDIEN